MPLLPFDQPGQEGFNRLLIADQIVVDEIDLAAIAELAQAVELGQYLVSCFRARVAAIEFDDVAELAGERATARELNTDIQVLLELEQIEARDRALCDIGLEFLGFEHASVIAAFPRGDEVGNDRLGLTEHPEVGLAINRRARSDIRAANHDRQLSF